MREEELVEVVCGVVDSVDRWRRRGFGRKRRGRGREEEDGIVRGVLV